MRIFLTLAALAMLSLPALADGPSVCWTTSPADDTWVGPDGNTYYTDRTDCDGAPVSATSSTCQVSLWIYEETNGHPGQQRGDEFHDDVARCTDGTQADADVF
jgi:hypothetical protein